MTCHVHKSNTKDKAFDERVEFLQLGRVAELQSLPETYYVSRFPYPFNPHEVVKYKLNTTISRIEFHIRGRQIPLRIVILLSSVAPFARFMKMSFEERCNPSLILLERERKDVISLGENNRGKHNIRVNLLIRLVDFQGNLRL